MIKVGIETSVFTNQSAFRGVGRYTAALITYLKKTEKIQVFEGNWRQFQNRVDLIHFPNFDFYFSTLPLFKKKKIIVTVHDCIPLVFPKYFPAGIKGKMIFFSQKLSLKNVSAVLADSENSKKDIIKFLSVPERKVFRVYLAADSYYKKIIVKDGEKEELFKKYGLKNDFILYVGDVNYNKNLLNTIRAFEKAKVDLDLVLIGKAFENIGLVEVRGLLALIKELKIQDRVKILGFVSDQELVFFYNLAVVYCQPSLYEGFGLQILEAMACGCPVVTANVSSMPEVAGKAAILVEPSDVNSIAWGIKRATLDRDLRCKMIKLGFEQAKNFSWAKTAQETIKVYEKVLE